MCGMLLGCFPASESMGLGGVGEVFVVVGGCVDGLLWGKKILCLNCFREMLFFGGFFFVVVGGIYCYLDFRLGFV